MRWLTSTLSYPFSVYVSLLYFSTPALLHMDDASELTSSGRATGLEADSDTTFSFRFEASPFHYFLLPERYHIICVRYPSTLPIPICTYSTLHTRLRTT